MTWSYPELVRDLRAVVEVCDRARALGLTVVIPDELVKGCREMVALRDGEFPYARAQAGGTLAADPVEAADDRAAELFHLVPLRAAVLMVIAPGDEVTAPVVVERLAELGMTAPAIQVSNVLGYHFAQGALERPRRGHYLRPV